jgi:hypothetical protein
VHPFTATWNALLPNDATSGRPAIACLGLNITDRPARGDPVGDLGQLVQVAQPAGGQLNFGLATTPWPR